LAVQLARPIGCPAGGVLLGAGRRAIAQAGLHPATGGDGSRLCSGDMLLEALVACAGVTLRAVATSIGVDLPSLRRLSDARRRTRADEQRDSRIS